MKHTLYFVLSGALQKKKRREIAVGIFHKTLKRHGTAGRRPE